AKRAVAIALRNRWRRQQVAEPLRQEITPKNILMIGPTGVGKTEIARRLARLADAPFIKVEATKFTEVGYVGRDVDTIIRDLAETAIKQTRESETRKVRDRASDSAEERVLDALLPPVREVNLEDMKPTDSATRQKFRKMVPRLALCGLRDGSDLQCRWRLQNGVSAMANTDITKEEIQAVFPKVAETMADALGCDVED